MTLGWFLFSVLVPPFLTVVAATVFKRSTAPPLVVIVLNGLMPGSGLAAAGRPFIEVTLGVLFSQIAMLVSQGPYLQYLGPIGFIGAAWGVLYTPWNPLTAQGLPQSLSSMVEDSDPAPNHQPSAAAKPSTRLDTIGSMAGREDDSQSDSVDGYAVTIRCTECGGEVDVPVLNHAAQCGYCGSHHLVVGQDDVLQVALPPTVVSVDDIREVVLDHLRYRYYLKLYQRSVAPLERQATQVGPAGGMSVRADVEAAAAAAEAAVSRKADRYREQLSAKIEITRTQSFVAPYGHAMGTLYQAAFGRCRRTQDKTMVFTMGSIETSVAAQKTVELPAMGKLSYLKSLVPAAQLGDHGPCALPYAIEPEKIEQSRTDLHRKQLDRSIQTIKLGSVFAEEVQAVVWRPWKVAEVKASGIHEVLLIDPTAGSVAGPGDFVDPELLAELPPEARDPNASLKFQPMECPTCGYEFRYEVDAVLHFCLNCHRLFDAHEHGKSEIEYEIVPSHVPDDFDLVPFWKFPLQLATADNTVITDLMHLKDGIDGTFDQVGDQNLSGQDDVWIPAIRCINTRLMTTAFKSLFGYVATHPARTSMQRFPLDVTVQPWPVCLDEQDVRSFAALFLANVFEPRDIARVNIHQVTAWLFEGHMQTRGRLVYFPIPREVTRSFCAYVGRYRGRAVAAVTGRS